jgi:Tol biopolymer transport system component
MKKSRPYFCLGLSLVFVTGLLGGQGQPALKTVSQELIGAVLDPNWDNDRLSYYAVGSAAAVDHWVLFGPDGRKLLPQIGVALADPLLVKWAKEDWAKSLNKSISCVDSCFWLKVLGLERQEIGELETALPVTNFHYSPDLKHWAIALISNPKGKHAVTIILDGKAVKTIDQPLAGRGLGLIPNAFEVRKEVLRAADYTMEFNADTSQNQLPVSGLTFSPDGNHLAYVVDTGKGKEGSYVVQDGRPGPRFDRIYPRSLSFSPDSAHLAYIVLKGKFWTGGDAALIYDDQELLSKDLDESSSRPVEFSPDGRYVFIRRTHNTGFGLNIRMKVFDLEQRQYLASGAEFIDCRFSRGGTKHLFLQEAPGQQKVKSSDFGESSYFKVENLFLSADGAHAAWAAMSRGKWLAVVDGQEKKPYLEIEYLTASPDGQHVAYAAKNDQKKWLFVLDDVEGGPFDKIEEPRRDDYQKYYPDAPVFFSPDSQHTALTVRQDKLSSLVVDGNVQASFKKMGTPVFGPDSQRVAVWASDGDKEFIVLDGKALPGFEKIDRWQIIFSPDGRHVAYKAKKDKEWFLVVDRTPSVNGFEVIVTAHPDRKSVVFSSPDSLYYVGLKGDKLYLVDEKIGAGEAEAK